CSSSGGASVRWPRAGRRHHRGRPRSARWRRNASLLGKPANGFGETPPLQAHHKIRGIPVFTATVASPPWLARLERERRIAVLVERAGPPEAAAALPAAAMGGAKQGSRHGGQVNPVPNIDPVDPATTSDHHPGIID